MNWDGCLLENLLVNIVKHRFHVCFSLSWRTATGTCTSTLTGCACEEEHSRLIYWKLFSIILCTIYCKNCKIIAVWLPPWSGVVEDSGTHSHGLYSIDWWILNCLKIPKILASYHEKYFLFKPEKNEKWSLLKWRQMILAASSNGRSRDRNLQSDSTHFSFTILGCVDASQMPQDLTSVL